MIAFSINIGTLKNVSYIGMKVKCGRLDDGFELVIHSYEFKIFGNYFTSKRERELSYSLKLWFI